MACIDYGTLEEMYDCLIDDGYSNGDAVTHLISNVDSSVLLPSGFALNAATNGIKYTDQSCVISQMSVLPTGNLNLCYDNYTMDDFFATEVYQNFIDGVEIGGCTDSSAMNYEPYATTDNGTCNYSETSGGGTGGGGTGGADDVLGCMDEDAINYNSEANIDCDDCCDFPDTTTTNSDLPLYENPMIIALVVVLAAFLAYRTLK